MSKRDSETRGLTHFGIRPFVTRNSAFVVSRFAISDSRFVTGRKLTHNQESRTKILRFQNESRMPPERRIYHNRE